MSRNQECGIREYFCWSREAHSYYIGLSLFYDIFGDEYTKPIYIERTPYTQNLEGRCQERRFLGRDFFSLIKTPRGIYRFNEEIYRDANQILKLPMEQNLSLARGLMRASTNEIQTIYRPREAYLAAAKNPAVASATSVLTKETGIPEASVGLIGSLSLDPTLEPRDLDLVLTGSVATLDLAYRWLREGVKEGPPLRRHLPPPLPTICPFFSADPLAYPDLSDFRILTPYPEEFSVHIGGSLSPSYLNLQIYSARFLTRSTEGILVVRDTLSRSTLESGMVVRLWGHLSDAQGTMAVLVTDVEKQILTVHFHGGGTKSESLNGAKA
jgi:hypothetical protein